MLQENQDIDTQNYVGKLEALIHSFNCRFQDFEQRRQQMQIFADPFAVPMDEVSPDYQLELIDLQSSDAMRAAFRDKTLLDFYKSLPATFVHLKDNALVHASMFGSTYRCEQTFSQMKLNKSSTRNQLTDDHLEEVLRLSTTNIQPDISKLVSEMQPQPSH